MEVEGTTTNGCIINEPQSDEEPLKNSATNAETTPGGFDCNICLDIAVEPVVTLCGHLYCWPCIYKWLQVDNSLQNCPVCKASLSETSLVPLYGRGHNSPKQTDQPVDVPNRPRLRIGHTDPEEGPHGTNVQRQRHHHHYHVHHHHYDNEVSSNELNEFISAPSSPLGGGAGSRALGGMAIAVLPLMLRNQSEVANLQLGNVGMYSFGGGSPRMRRQEKEVQRSLHQIWLFLSCCALLCLFLF